MKLSRFVVQRQRLFEVDDVDPVAFAEDERGHLRVPEAGLMSEMDARFQHLSHGHAGHDQDSCVGLSLHPPHVDDPVSACGASRHPVSTCDRDARVRDFVAKNGARFIP